MLKKSVQSLPIAVLAAAVTLAPAWVSACGTEAYTGQICVTAATFCPENTAEAAGQILTISSNPALNALIGCTYGGDCKTTFALPDLRGRAPVGYGQGTGLTTHPMGQMFGSEYVTQTQAQMPVHNHSATLSGGSGSAVSVAVGTSAGNTAVPTAGQTVYLSGLSGNFNSDPVNMNGPYTTTAPSSMAKLGGVSGGGSGGTITVSNTGGSQAMPNVPPEIAMRYCIVTNGIFPQRPN